MKSVYFLISITLFILFIYGCDKEMYVEPKSYVKENTNKVFINSSPQGASIYLNGRITGQFTPDTIKWLSEGNQEFNLKMKYFLDTSFTIKAEPNTTNSYMVDYSRTERMLGKIYCFSTPKGAKVYLDGQYTGFTSPVVLGHLLPGHYSVKYESPEYRKDSVSIIVQSNQTTLSSVQLEDTLDIITYSMKNAKLPSNNITSVVEDRSGNMWFGTGMDGLLKFDGKNFYSYRAGNDYFVLSNSVTRLRIDMTGNLWVGYSLGMSKFDGTNWSLYKSKMINSLQISNNNEMIASVDRGGILKYSGGQLINYTDANSGLSNNNMFSACIDNNGHIWAGSYNIGNGVDFYDGSKWSRLDSIKNRLPYNQNLSFEVDKNGTLFGIFYKYPDFPDPTPVHIVAKYNSGSWIKIFTGRAEASNHEFYFDARNYMWFALKGSGIYRINNANTAVPIAQLVHNGLRKFQLASDKTTFTMGEKVFVDSKGNLWIVGGLNGIVKIKSGRWD